MHASPVDELERTWQVCHRLEFSPDQEDVAGSLLEPAASLLDADTAVFRTFSVIESAPCLTAAVGLGFRDSVHDAYRNRYLALDPARSLLRRRFSEPLLSDLGRSSEACAAATGTPSASQRFRPISGQLRQAFLRYRREFLLPNDFFHHIGFCFQDTVANRTFFLDFHRPQASSPFNELDVVRAKIMAMVLHLRVSDLGTMDDCNEVELRKHLSTREIDVAHAVARGLSNKEVGAALEISVRTVENHLRSIYSKLGISTRTRLVAKVHELRGHAPARLSRTNGRDDPAEVVRSFINPRGKRDEPQGAAS